MKGNRAYPHMMNPWAVQHLARHDRNVVDSTSYIQSLHAVTYTEDSNPKTIVGTVDDNGRAVISLEPLLGLMYQDSVFKGSNNDLESSTIFLGHGYPCARSKTRIRLHPKELGHYACIRQYTHTLHLFDKDRLRI